MLNADAPIIIPSTDPRYGQLRFDLAIKLSEITRLALNDLKKAEACGLYHLDMGTYHDPIEDAEPGDPKCTICFAGSVMAFSLGAKITESKAASDYGDEDDTTYRKLVAIDALRDGCVEAALDVLYGENDDFESAAPPAQKAAAEWIDAHSNLSHSMTRYENNEEGFKAEIEVLIALMEYKGL